MTIYHVYALVVVFVVLFGGIMQRWRGGRGPNVAEVPIALTDASMGRVL